MIVEFKDFGILCISRSLAAGTFMGRNPDILLDLTEKTLMLSHEPAGDGEALVIAG